MSLLDPISTVLVEEESSAFLRRALHHARVVGNFALIQAGVQILGFLSGILIVRTLSQHEYAYFTIANSMQATISMLADVGIGVGLVSIGGRVWHDRRRFGELINTGLKARRKLAVAAIIIVTPILYLMLSKNGAPVFQIVVLIALVLISLSIELSVGVFGVVPRLNSDIARIQLIDSTGTVVRLILLLILVYTLFLNASIAVAVATATFLLQYFMLRSYASKVVDLSAPENPQDRQAIFGFTRKLAANTLFYCFQGQITVFLISFFGRQATSVAEVGALGRLAMIFTVLSTLLTNIFVPAFARCQDERKLRWLYAAIVGAVVAFSLAVLACAAIFPEAFLFVLGNKYTHLHRELLFMVGVAVVSALTGTFWSLNASKAWIAGAWLYVPLTLGTQIALIPFTNFSTVTGVLLFNLLSALPNLLLNMGMSYHGFRRFTVAIA